MRSIRKTRNRRAGASVASEHDVRGLDRTVEALAVGWPARGERRAARADLCAVESRLAHLDRARAAALRRLVYPGEKATPLPARVCHRRGLLHRRVSLARQPRPALLGAAAHGPAAAALALPGALHRLLGVGDARAASAGENRRRVVAPASRHRRARGLFHGRARVDARLVSHRLRLGWPRRGAASQPRDDPGRRAHRRARPHLARDVRQRHGRGHRAADRRGDSARISSSASAGNSPAPCCSSRSFFPTASARCCIPAASQRCRCAWRPSSRTCRRM